ncbi:hypothetical protein CEF21_07000 [Bacillus sp. FJAT-42376]|nr:hypothetical protein CEF21_07000 [Bacillus sp. FJAT-42376]
MYETDHKCSGSFSFFNKSGVHVVEESMKIKRGSTSVRISIFLIPGVLNIFMPHVGWFYLMGIVLYGHVVYLNRDSKAIVMRQLMEFVLFIALVYIVSMLFAVNHWLTFSQ